MPVPAIERRRSFPQGRILTLMLVVAVGMAAIVVLYTKNNHALEDAQGWEHHSYLVLQSLDNIDRDLHRALETEHRYIRTGQAADLRRYQITKQVLLQDLKASQSLVADNRSQVRRATGLATATEAVIAALDAELRRATATPHAPPNDVSAGFWSHLLDLLQRQQERATAMQLEEDQLLARRTQTTGVRLRHLHYWFDSGIALNLALLAWLAAEVRRRFQAARRLSVSEERFRLLVEGVRDYAILQLDQEGRVVSWNKGAERITGYTAPQILGRNFAVFYTEADRAQGKPQQELRAALEGGRLEDAGMRVRADGSSFQAETIITPLHNEKGELRGFAKITRDVTAERNHRQVLEERSLLLDLAPAAILVRDGEGHITYWNRGAEQLYGWTRSEALGKVSHELLQTVFPVPLEGIERELREAGRWNGELRHRDRTGNEVPVLSRWRLHLTGQQDSVLEVNADISERKHYEDTLLRQSEELERSNQELERFAFLASHDLQEPLRMIASYTELLSERYGSQLDERGRRYLHYATGGAHRMRLLIENLLTYSRLNAPRKQLRQLSAKALVAEALDNQRSELESREADVDVAPLPEIYGVESDLVQLFQNLISNALKFSPGRPRIELGCTQVENHWLFCCRDHGIGIEPRFREKVFEIFQRLNARQEFEGTGIGLAICRKIVESHGGRIWADETPGGGASFYFTIPVQPLQQDVHANQSQHPAGGR